MRKVMDSTGMGETYAAHEAVRVIEVYLKLLESMGVKVPRPVKLYVHNESVCKLQNGLRNMTGAKHYRIAQAYIVDHVNSGEVELCHIASENNPADLLTKALHPRLHQAHSKISMGGGDK